MSPGTHALCFALEELDLYVSIEQGSEMHRMISDKASLPCGADCGRWIS